MPRKTAANENRMWPNFKLEHFGLYDLEAHDLALTKLERNADVDRQDVLELSRAGYVDPEILRDRYVKEVRPNLCRIRYLSVVPARITALAHARLPPRGNSPA